MTQPLENWEIEWDKINWLKDRLVPWDAEIKDFISSLLKSELDNRTRELIDQISNHYNHGNYLSKNYVEELKKCYGV